ncbi:MAG: DUF1800 domain-containing protein [Polyangiaceae bacterium]|nr:DUF1800 domain-containing protein [Polyangiaceae bacterium]MCB9607899.1 DUF1800 domain-containing protein [Polyangiaceae bacterium]
MSSERRAAWFLAATLTVGCGGSASVPAAHQVPPEPASATLASLDAQGARHVLSRFAFGPRPGEVEALQRQGLTAWLDAQLKPEGIPDAEADRRLEPYLSSLSPDQQLRAFRALKKGGTANPDTDLPELTRKDFRELAARAQLLELGRFVESDRQLQEVMTDFWSNHFNVYARKGPVRFLTSDYVERTLRPHALGKFEDLLLATAKHPAMLIYLDNAKSVKAGAPGTPAAKRKKGLNENYARELLELHTLGVDGGYTQQDVIEVARVLTGWSVTRPQEDELGFKFRARQHDNAAKTVLGTQFPAGGGQAEGERLIRMLARHPATARHLARKLCARFVSDDPPAACVGSAAQAYMRSEGDIATVVRTIATGGTFWAPAVRGAKIKSPLELVVSAVRAADGHLDGGVGLGRTLAELGQPLFLYAAPTGYPERGDAWMGPGQALSRMRFGIQFAAGRVDGISYEADRVLPLVSEPAQATANVNRVFFAGTLGKESAGDLEEELKGLSNSKQLRAHAVAFAVGGPEFQRQ